MALFCVKNQKVALELEEVAVSMKAYDTAYKLLLEGDLEVEPLEEATLVPRQTRALFKMDRSELITLGYELLSEMNQVYDFFDMYGAY